MSSPSCNFMQVALKKKIHVQTSQEWKWISIILRAQHFHLNIKTLLLRTKARTVVALICSPVNWEEVSARDRRKWSITCSASCSHTSNIQVEEKREWLASASTWPPCKLYNPGKSAASLTTAFSWVKQQKESTSLTGPLSHKWMLRQ